MDVPDYFRRYLRAIQPASANRRRAIQLHKTLTDRLTDDKKFKDWYLGTFLYGSYRRNTAVQPIKDVDICVLLNINHNDHQPEAVVSRLRRVLESNGYEGKTALQRRSIRIDMSGTTLDVVPVVPTNGVDQPLLIPDRPLEQWVTTHPKGHLATTTRLNKEGGKRFVPFVKIVKAWYRYQAYELRKVERPKPKGFTLEALVAQYQDSDAPTYANAFVVFLTNLHTACGSSLSKGIFPEVPDPGVPGQNLKVNFSPDEAKLFGSIAEDALDKARMASQIDNDAESAIAWQSIFGPKFPSPPSAKLVITTKSEAIALSEADDDTLDDEISDIEFVEAQKAGKVRIMAGLALKENGSIQRNYPNDGWALDKDMWLRFCVDWTDVKLPYEIRWTVQNHGREAEKANDVRHVSNGTSRTKWEHTKYRGSQWMICELHHNGVVLASTKHIVNIK